MNNNDYCIIMAGGIGSRFWPMSRTKKPKQFLDILGTGKTFIRQTFERFARIIPVQNFLVVTGEIYKELVLKEIPELNESQVLCEPMRRNTAPCIVYATCKLLKINPQARVVVTPSDHFIFNENKFLEVMLNGLAYAGDNNALVTVGLKPSRPETGYGYIQVEKEDAPECQDSVCKVKTFTEKPDIETARIFFKSGEFYWNSGIFIWSLDAIRKALARHLPDVTEIFAAGNDYYNTDREESFIFDAYSQCKSISIDYGLMEKAENVYVFAADFGWSDVGTWNSLYIQMSKDENSNALKSSNVYLSEVSNSMIDSANPNKLLVVKGLENYLIVDTEDVLMICPRNDEESIKQTVSDVLADKGKDFI
ncbi:MAG: mannose-1-phosphate guanylyltransferase [Prevotellaceae bacterium]|jgi:mannose-1-phosphate guanylyltransferase|nr:mannose-1-phosphate guanylyltransferase [Prevotellaceae bacterium]